MTDAFRSVCIIGRCAAVAKQVGTSDAVAYTIAATAATLATAVALEQASDADVASAHVALVTRRIAAGFDTGAAASRMSLMG